VPTVGIGFAGGGMSSTFFDNRFFSLAAYQLRIPLTAVVGYLEMLLDEEFGPLTDDQRESLEIVSESAQSLRTITNSLLDAARIEAGRVELVLQPTDLPALVEAVAADLKPQLEAKAQRLTLNASPDLPPASCDERRAAQIIGHLLSNASEHTSQGGLISVSLEPAEEEGFLRVAVASPDPHTARAYLVEADSDGLSLHITRALVVLHGGCLWFESEPGEAPTFHATFPIAERSATLPNEPAATADA
jgi:signal transduction histidine kinase